MIEAAGWHLDIGRGSTVAAWQVVAVLPVHGRAMRRLRDEAYQQGRLIDACRGVSAQSIIITKSNHVIMSACPASDILDQQIRQDEAECSADIGRFDSGKTKT